MCQAVAFFVTLAAKKFSIEWHFPNSNYFISLGKCRQGNVKWAQIKHFQAIWAYSRVDKTPTEETKNQT